MNHILREVQHVIDTILKGMSADIEHLAFIELLESNQVINSMLIGQQLLRQVQGRIRLHIVLEVIRSQVRIGAGVVLLVDEGRKQLVARSVVLNMQRNGLEDDGSDLLDIQKDGLRHRKNEAVNTWNCLKSIE